MATVYTDNVLPETSGVNENITLGAAGDTVTLPTGVTLKNNTMKDSGGNTMFTSNGSGTLSSINSSFSGGGPALLSTATASDSANLSFSNTYLTSTYKYYLIKFIEIVPATNDVEFMGQITTSGGNPNTSSSNLMNWYGLTTGDDFGPVGAWNRTGTNSNAIYISGSGLMNNATETGSCLSGEMKLYSPAGVKQKFWSTRVSHIRTPVQIMNICWGGMNETAVAITLLTFTMSSGNIASGQIKLYGVGA